MTTAPTAYVRPAPAAGWFYTNVEPDPAIPGPRKVKREWAVSRDVLALIAPGVCLDLRPASQHAWDKRLYKHQLIGAELAMERRRLMLAWEMRTGKTPTTIVALRALTSYAGKFAVVCPAMVRGTWEEHLATWWPVADVHVIRPGRKIRPAFLTVASYEMAGKLDLQSLGHVVFDESHYVKDPEAKRSLVAARLAAQARTCILLTGTPVGNSAEDIWHQIELLCPGAFGSRYAFLRRYAIQTVNSAGYPQFHGVQPERAAELATRIGAWSSRVTEADVAGAMPALMIETIRVPPPKLPDADAAIAAFLLGKNTSLAGSKDSYVAAMVNEAHDMGQTHVAVMCHLRETAERLAGKLGAQCITGDMPEPKRHEVLRSMRAAPTATLVATFHSLSTGVNLAAFPEVIYPELDWKVNETVQSFARFREMNGRNARIRVLTFEGTVEERIADCLAGKIRDNAALLKPGTVDTALGEALSKTRSDEEIMAELMGKLAG